MWEELANWFIKQYWYNLDTVPSRMDLHNIEMSEGQSLRGYMKQWRDITANVHPPLAETKAVPIFISTLKGAYYTHLLSHVSYSFSYLVHAREMVELEIHLGKI